MLKSEKNGQAVWEDTSASQNPVPDPGPWPQSIFHSQLSPPQVEVLGSSPALGAPAPNHTGIEMS